MSEITIFSCDKCGTRFESERKGGCTVIPQEGKHSFKHLCYPCLCKALALFLDCDCHWHKFEVWLNDSL